MSAGTRRAGQLCLLAFAVAAIGYLEVAKRFTTGADEAWFLQVVSRVRHGDTLYADVFFGSTPLSVYVALPFVAAIGEVAVISALLVACLLASFALVVRLLDLVGVRVHVVVVALALVAWAPVWPASLYQPLATVFALLCFALAVSWSERPSAAALAGAGAAAGLAFAAKPNVGVLVVAALCVAIAVRGASVRRFASALGVAALAAILPLIPVFASGASSAFWDFAVVKSGYRKHGSRDYLHTLSDFGSLAGHPSFGNLKLVYLQAAVLAPLVLLVLLGAAWRLAPRDERRRLAIVTAFSLAFAATLFPRAELFHVQVAFPGMFVGMAYAGAVIARGRPVGAWAVPAVAAAAALTLVPYVAVPVVKLAAAKVELGSVPHFRGVLVRPAEEKRWRENAARLAAGASARPTFLLSSDAAFHYLVAGLDDPTPFDFPYVTTFGRDGEARLRRDAAAGRFDVCVGGFDDPSIAPTRLIAFVRTHLERRADLGVCVLYRSP